MHASSSTPATALALLVWAVSLLSATAVALAAPEPISRRLDISINIDLGDLANLTARPLCDQYAFVANYSAIGANATMRDALANASPHGADIVAHVVDAAMKVADYFAHDTAINGLCGNLSMVAGQEAANNFSNGIVADQVVGGKGLGAGARAGGGGSLVLVVTLALLVLVL
ncbi:hypothetical protein PG994_008922 [Apiospora phragmitis]|uniref:Uncharacterized protein n=1 Tax=Apiospora phragmitis TaxID=2905665 RepID=A0ABR1UKU9_9PEZI